MSFATGEVAYQFGGFVLDPVRGTLLAVNGQAVALRPKAFSLLRLLVENAGRLLDRDTIMLAVWPGIAIADDGITQCVRDIRRALGDDAQRIVKTVQGRGYTLGVEATATRDRPVGGPNVSLFANKPSIAVLPFANLSGDPEQDYFSDGVVEEITNAIARMPWLFVIARNSSFTYKGKAVDVKQVGRELGVRYVLEGSVRKAGNNIRITGELIDTAVGVQIWSDRIDGVLNDIFALQDQVASSVAGAIEPKLKLAEIERAHRKPTTSLDAYDLYLRALAEFREPGLDNCAAAIDLLQQALRIDPSYAPAAGLVAHVRRHQHVMGVLLSRDQIDEAIQAARRAIVAGRDDPDALWMGGHTLALLAGDLATALRAIERATTLNPNCALAWWAHGAVNCFANYPDVAISSTQRAICLSPLDPMAYQFRHMLAFGLMLAGRHQEAMECIDKSLYDRPDYHPSLRIKIALCGYLGLVEAGREYVRRQLEANPAMTIAGFQALTDSHHAPETTAVFVEGLRRAGLPEQ